MPENSANPMLAADCPRCGQPKTTFDVLSCVPGSGSDLFEAFALCRHCWRPSIAELYNRNSTDPPSAYRSQYINHTFDIRKWVQVIPTARQCPEYVPDGIERIYAEAAKCEAIGLWDAAGAMFRKVLDASTRLVTPSPIADDTATPAWKVYKDLRLRLDWLFERQLLDPALREISSCIHQDGNDAAHSLAGIGREEATDLADFTTLALRTMFTLPGQIDENKRRRQERRANQNSDSA
jgi:hypothetical protein